MNFMKQKQVQNFVITMRVWKGNNRKPSSSLHDLRSHWLFTRQWNLVDF